MNSLGSQTKIFGWITKHNICLIWKRTIFVAALHEPNSFTPFGIINRIHDYLQISKFSWGDKSVVGNRGYHVILQKSIRISNCLTWMNLNMSSNMTLRLKNPLTLKKFKTIDILEILTSILHHLAWSPQVNVGFCCKKDHLWWRNKKKYLSISLGVGRMFLN